MKYQNLNVNFQESTYTSRENPLYFTLYLSYEYPLYLLSSNPNSWWGVKNGLTDICSLLLIFPDRSDAVPDQENNTTVNLSLTSVDEPQEASECSKSDADMYVPNPQYKLI